jgi:hypothetical protein
MQNRGQFGNANDGIATARGEYVAIHHADDIYLPTIVEREAEFLDDLNDFYDPEWKRENLAIVSRQAPSASKRRVSGDRDRVEAVVRDRSIEAVIHLAARAGVRPSIEQPLLYEHVNVYGTMVVLEACRTPPVSPYAATKLAGEKSAIPTPT